MALPNRNNQIVERQKLVFHNSIIVELYVKKKHIRLTIHVFLMKIILFVKILGSTQLCKISQESGLLSNFVNLAKIRIAHFGHCGPLGIKGL